MKKTLTTILFILSSIIIFGQARLGSSIADIRSEFRDSNFNLKSGYDSDGDYYINVELERAFVTYYFDNSFCYITIIVPKNQGALNALVQIYNERYVIKSNTEWNMYSGKGMARIRLIFDEDDSYYFIWSNL